MSIATNLQRLVDAKSDIADAITAKGGTVNQGDGFEEFPADIASIPRGGSGIDAIFNASCSTSKAQHLQYVRSIVKAQQTVTFQLPDSSASAVSGYNIWSDGANVYYSDTYNQYVYDSSTSGWLISPLTGLSPFNGEHVWNYNGNTYYTGGSNSARNGTYRLNKYTNSWTKLNDDVTVYGYNVWTDGENAYSSSGSDQYVWNGSAWVSKSWSGSGLTSFYGYNVWYDGDDVYYSEGYAQRVLNKSTSTWSTKTWSGLTSFDGRYVWSDGENVYYSSGSTQKVLDKSTSTWSTKTWSGLTSFDGRYVWSDGENVYYSSGSNQYVLDKSTSTWNVKSYVYYKKASVVGRYVWSDGNNIYYSYNGSNYVLNKSTSAWSTKIWSGLTSFDGQYVWSDGENVYYSSGSTQKVLDKSTSTWSTKTWSGLTSFDGRYVWSNGNNIYYSYNGSNYVLNKSTSAWSTKTWSGLTYIDGSSVWFDGDNYIARYLQYNTSTYNTTYGNWYKLTGSIWIGLGISSDGNNKIITDGNVVCIYVSNAYYTYDLSSKNITNIQSLTFPDSYNYLDTWSDGYNTYYSNSNYAYILKRTYPDLS